MEEILVRREREDMRVKDIMTANAKACTLTNSLAEAAGFMWEHDCGILPVLAEAGKVVGLITDRDICMAAAMRNRNLEKIAVEDVVSKNVFSCKPDDDVRAALKTMQENRVRRLPVVTVDGKLEGILSMNDIVLRADGEREKKPTLPYKLVVDTYRAICEHRLPTHQVSKAAGA